MSHILLFFLGECCKMMIVVMSVALCFFGACCFKGELMQKEMKVTGKVGK